MVRGTLKETLIFLQDNTSESHRYEIYKSESKDGYFIVIYTQRNIIYDGSSLVIWIIDNPHYCLKSHYIPNARMECESHWKENYLNLNVL